MPRDGSGVYSKPAGTTASPNTTIESAKYNATVDDLVVDANAARPVTAGGTGAATAVGGADNLSPAAVNVASAATTDIGAAASPNVNVTGTTTITSFGTAPSGVKRWVTFSGILTLTHNATSLILKGGANITTAAGDTATFVSEGSGNWRCLSYDKASGQAIVTPPTGAGKLDVRRNRVVNGDKLMSQENAQTAGTTNGRYISDQNAMYFSTSAGTFTGVNVAGRTSPKGGNRDRITITSADASLAAGEFLTYTQNIEASSVADLKWGTAGATGIMVRRGFNYPAGTWPVAFHNSAANRSYVTTFTVSAPEAGTDIVREFAIPGDVTGTYLTADGVIGWTMDAVIGAGSTFQGAAGWQPGNMLTVSGATNGMASVGAIFEFFDEGVRADPDATGVYGQYEVGETDAVYRSERYWEAGSGLILGYNIGGANIGTNYNFSVTKAKTPSMATTGGSTGNLGGVGNTAVTAKNFTAFATVAVTGSAQSGFGFTANARLS